MIQRVPPLLPPRWAARLSRCEKRSRVCGVNCWLTEQRWAAAVAGAERVYPSGVMACVWGMLRGMCVCVCVCVHACVVRRRRTCTCGGPSRSATRQKTRRLV